MADDVMPTPEDLARDLRADLWLFTGQGDAALWVRFLHVPTNAANAQRLIDMARTRWPAAICRALAAEAEVARLQGIVNGLADRVAAQSELLSRKAEEKRP